MTTEIKYVDCPECEGRGEQMWGRLYPSGHTEVWEPCCLCNGDGNFEESDYLMMKLEGTV